MKASISARIFRVLLTAAASSLLGACGLTMNPRYQPGPLAVPWEARKPKIFLGSMTDKSSGILFSGSASSGRSGKFARPLSECLREAFTKEFERLGIPLVKSLKDADAHVSASWRETTIELPAGFAVTDTATIRLGLAVKAPDNRMIYSEEIVGRAESGSHHPGCCPGGSPARALDAALAKAMKSVEELFMTEIVEQIFMAQSSAVAAQAPAVQAVEKSDVDTVPEFAGKRRKAHAVVIGVERYRQQLPTADFADNDARLVAKYLLAAGYPVESVAVLTNDGASRSDLVKYLERWLPNRVEPGDEVFVYYSGHGSPNPSTGDAYLVPFDGDPLYLDQTAYSVQKLYAALAKLPTKNVTVVLDSCFSGAGGRSVLAKGARPLVNVKAQASIPEELTVLSAAAGNQISQSYQDKGHGLFTYFFLKGLAQQARAGTMNMKRIFDYAAPEVRRVARQEYNTDQAPQWHGGDL